MKLIKKTYVKIFKNSVLILLFAFLIVPPIAAETTLITNKVTWGGTSSLGQSYCNLHQNLELDIRLWSQFTDEGSWDQLHSHLVTGKECGDQLRAKSMDGNGQLKWGYWESYGGVSYADQGAASGSDWAYAVT